jgi:hypothetical protein
MIFKSVEIPISFESGILHLVLAMIFILKLLHSQFYFGDILNGLKKPWSCSTSEVQN